MQQQFSSSPVWSTAEHDGDEYLGTWFGCDVYLATECGRKDVLVVRFGDEPNEYATDGNVGWDTLAPTNRVGGLGENRYAADVRVNGIAGYNNDIDKASLVALAMLGRQFLDGRRTM